MYEGKYDYRLRRRKKRLFRMAFLMVVSAAMGAGCMFMAMRVFGASELVKEETAQTGNTAKVLKDAGNILLSEISEDKKSPEKPVLEKQQRQDGKLIVVLDPGHGGEDDGALRAGTMEKNVNLEIAILLKSKLTDLGYLVIMTREDDSYIEKEKRVELAEYYQADIFVSIHQNSEETDGPEAALGIETWYDGRDSLRDSKRLAGLIHQETVALTGANWRELKGDAEFYVTSRTTMASCLIETGFLSNAEERVNLINPEYQERIAAGIANGIALYFNPKVMYLTFDDGPSAENTSAVLDILKARNIKATFFVVGKNVRKNPEVVRRIAAEGHTIGIHCNSHEYGELYQSVDTYLADFEEAYQAVREVTGVDAKLFRFPGGSINAYNKNISEDIIKEMTSRGFIYYDWNASLEDALKKSAPEELIKNARDTALGRKKVVLLAHDIVYSTSQCLNNLIDAFPEYKMEALTTDTEPVHFTRFQAE